MQEDFELESILSILTGINCTDNFINVYELFWFIFEDNSINAMGISALKETAKKHILSIHPELKTIKYNSNINLDSWIEDQKNLFGNELTISIIGEPIISLKRKSYQSNR